MYQITGSSLSDLWINLVIYNACDSSAIYFHPYLLMRYLYIETQKLEFDNLELESDFFKYSGYNKAMKLSQLRKEYYTGKVEKQYHVIKKYLSEFSPRQSRASIYFSEPAFDKTSKLKCLESLYFQKTSKKEYEAFIVFRNTELYPKLYMDFYYLKELLDEIDRDTGMRCVGFKGVIVNAFLRLEQVKLIEMLLKDWGISNFSPGFNKLAYDFSRKYNKEKVQRIKLISIKRILDRTFRLMEEENG